MKYSFPTMTTDAHLDFQVTPALRRPPEKIAALVKEAMAEIVELMGPGGRRGDIRRLNDSQPGQWIAFHPRTWHVVEEATLWHELSGGAFDPTVGAAKRLFKFNGDELERWPAPSEIEAARLAVGLEKIKKRPEDRSLSLTKPGQRLDLGAIAKGYAVDLAVEILEECGVENAMVEIGGEVKVLGLHPGPPPRPWRVGVEDPRFGGRSEFALEMSNSAVASSGGLRRYFVYQGRAYSHTIDPRSCRPLENNILGVTAAHPRSCMTADALSTALAILGPERGFDFLRRAFRQAPEKVMGLTVIMFIQRPGAAMGTVTFSIDEHGASIKSGGLR